MKLSLIGLFLLSLSNAHALSPPPPYDANDWNPNGPRIEIVDNNHAQRCRKEATSTYGQLARYHESMMACQNGAATVRCSIAQNGLQQCSSTPNPACKASDVYRTSYENSRRLLDRCTKKASAYSMIESGKAMIKAGQSMNPVNAGLIAAGMKLIAAGTAMLAAINAEVR